MGGGEDLHQAHPLLEGQSPTAEPFRCGHRQVAVFAKFGPQLLSDRTGLLDPVGPVLAGSTDPLTHLGDELLVFARRDA